MKNTRALVNETARLVAAFALLLAALVVAPAPARAQAAPEYRGYWVETFNSQLGTRAEIDRVVDAAVQSNANALFAQVRRRGDSWYLDTKEPLTQVPGVGEPAAPGGPWTFDPLAYLIERAHANNIEVHAFVIVGAIYNAHPTITGLPADPKHVFNTNFWDKAAGAPYPVGDPRQWSTRSLPHHQDGTSFNGQRYVAEWYVDLGHPAAAAYTVDALTHLVRRYDVDGIHLDRIRYPEAPIDRVSGRPLGINTGYNETSVNRFKARHGSAASYYQTSEIGTVVNTTPSRAVTAGDVGYPKTNDPLWNQWRRDQVTNFVRRLYLNATAVKPRVKVSAALICFWTGPTASGGWTGTEAYYRVFQDWRAWAREGTLDIIAPMAYKREHITTAGAANERAQYEDWLRFTKELAAETGRHALPGLGNYLNGVEGTLIQARKALARPPYDVNNASADGVIFYALGNTLPGNLTGNSTSAAVTNNPLSFPTAGVSTPKRTNADFFAAVRTGKNAAGTVTFESPALAPLFPAYVGVPDMPWKSAPTLGHLMGFAKRSDGTPLDTAKVTIRNLETNAERETVTDGGGFYGGVGLAPGSYLVKVELNGETLYSCQASVAAGVVSTADAGPETDAPVTTASPAGAAGQNGWYTGPVGVSLSAADACSGVASTEYSFDGASWQPYAAPVAFTADGVHTLHFRSTDRAGNVETAQSITVKIDQTAPALSLTATPSVIWPPNNQPFTAAVGGSASDATSGLAGVSYVVTDEYGAPLSIPARPLGGGAANWSEALTVEASRRGDDLDGRLYRVTATATDQAGNTSTATADILVPHDRRPR